MPLDVVIDLEASFAALAAGEHDHDGMLKFPQDLIRYAAIIAASWPEVIVETGTRTGETARWFADQGLDVITIDDNPTVFGGSRDGLITLNGDSADAALAARVAELVAGRSCMVSLDSAHNAVHVTREIELYGPLVSVGCYLVVEDAIWGYADEALHYMHGEAGMQGSPLDAIEALLVDNPAWRRDLEVERMFPVSHNPAGWWQRLPEVVP